MEAILIQKDSEISVNEKVDSKDEVVLAGVETLANAPLIPKSQDIFKYWANHYNQQLGEVCLVVLSLPMTQVSVKRTFSGLKYILSDLRMRMSSEVVDAIMVLRSNN